MKERIWFVRDGVGEHHESDLAEGLVNRLKLALSIARRLPKEPTAANQDDLRALGETLHDIRYAIPDVKLWCVMKHYFCHDSKTGAWAPAVWTAHLSKKQAEQFRDAIDAHYTAEAKLHNWKLDRWEVELRPARFSEIIDPKCSVKAYIERISV